MSSYHHGLRTGRIGDKKDLWRSGLSGKQHRERPWESDPDGQLHSIGELPGVDMWFSGFQGRRSRGTLEISTATKGVDLLLLYNIRCSTSPVGRVGMVLQAQFPEKMEI